MTLIELSKLTEQHQDNYYQLLLIHSTLIIREVGLSSKRSVSKALHINPSQFSGVYGCIVAYDNIVTKG